MKRAKDRKTSADMQEVISELNAGMNNFSESAVKLSPFKASSNFLIIPINGKYSHFGPQHMVSFLRIRERRLALNRWW